MSRYAGICNNFIIILIRSNSVTFFFLNPGINIAGTESNDKINNTIIINTSKKGLLLKTVSIKKPVNIHIIANTMK